MINHLRTLLLNVDGSSRPETGYPGEEFVEPTFKATALTPALLTVRQALFGVAPDRALLNYRLRQLTTCVHATELGEYATALDSRVTYWPVRDPSIFDNLNLGTVILQTAGPAQAGYVIGGPLTGNGRMYYKWRVASVDPTHVQIDVLTSPQGTTTVEYEVAGGLSSPIPLPGSTLKFMFAQGQPVAYVVTALARPSLSLHAVAGVADGVMTLPVRDALFTAAEPYLTFSNLWSRHPQLPYRVGGLALALAYRTEALRS